MPYSTFRRSSPSFARTLRPGLLLAAALSALPCSSSAQSYRLNAPFEFESVVGDVQDFAVKHNGSFVFYRADARLPGVFELFTVPALGGATPFRENRRLPPDRAVVAYQPSPVGNWIVFIADQDQDDVFELYSHKPSDNVPRKLSGALTGGGDVLDFVISPDGTRVVYRSDQDADEVNELYSVPIDGSASAVEISGTMVAGGDVPYGLPQAVAYSVSPSSTRVVYVADQEADERYELFSAPIDGSAGPVKLNAPFPAGGGIPYPYEVSLSPDGTTVVYRADQDADELYEAFRVPIDGSASPTQINAALVAGGDVTGVLITPDGARALYTADQDTDGVIEVYSAPLDGSAAPVKLNTPGQPTGAGPIAPDSSRVVLFTPSGLKSVPVDGSAAPVLLDIYPSPPSQFDALAISPDSNRLVYRTTGPDDCELSCTVWDSLRSVPLDGSGSAVRLDDPGGTAHDYNFQPATPFAFSADSSRVVYAWADGTEYSGLYSVPIDRSAAPTPLALAPVGPLFATAPSGTRAFFTADLSGTGAFELHSVQLTDGAGLVKLSGKLARDTFADVDSLPSALQDFALDPAGERVVYTADPNVNDEFELFSVPADGRSPALTISADRKVDRFRIGPDGERVVYWRLGEIYSVPSSGGSAIKLNQALPAGRSVGAFSITADGSHVVFQVSGGSTPSRLFTVPLAGGASPLQLEDDMSAFALSPSSNRAVYTVRSTGPTGIQEQLFGVLDDGSASPVALSPVTPGGIAFAISADGNRVAFEGGTTLVPGSIGVFGAPIDGSASPIRLSGSLSSASGPLISPDGLWVVFRGSGASESGIFGARIDGSLGPVNLNGPLVPGGSIRSLAGISPDSSRVVYTADQDVNGVIELYSVPIDGSASPVKLNGALVGGGDVVQDSSGTAHVQITSDGSRVLYVADQDTDDVLELYSAPLEGGASPIKLNGALVSGGDVAANAMPIAFRISPDSTRVVYVADQDADGLKELYLVPLDGSLAPRKLNWPLVGNGVSSLEITSGSRRVVYQATERSQVTELFASELSFDPGHDHVAPHRRP